MNPQLYNEMFLKIHTGPGGERVVAVCDRELMDTTISDGAIQIAVTSDFYGDTLATEEDVRAALLSAENGNIIGSRVVALAVSLGLVDPDSCLVINSIPHAQFI